MPENVEEFCQWAQVANYEAMRAMFDAFGVNRPVSTGIVQWMLNSSWPELYWQLYDYYLMPNGAFYATKKASTPVHLAYNYSDESIYIINETRQDIRNFNSRIQLFNLNSDHVHDEQIKVNAKANIPGVIHRLPSFQNIGPVYFLDLRLYDAEEKLVSNDFYWLSEKEDVLDFENSRWFVTPNEQYADFSALKELPEAGIALDFIEENTGSGLRLTITLNNQTDRIAFFIEMQVFEKSTGETVLPVFWTDNYISLLPDEQREVEVTFSKEYLQNEVGIHWHGINVPSSSTIY
jgi:exo-1,4-beta-D-glucosaminidase